MKETLIELFFDCTGDIRRFRTVWRMAFFLIAFLAIQIVVGLLVILGIVAYMGLPLDTLPHWILANAALVMVTSAIPMALSVAGVTWLFRKYLDKRTFRSLGHAPLTRPVLLQAGMGYVIGFCLITVATSIVWILGGLTFTGIGGTGLLWFLLPMLLPAAYTEELLCRGYILQNFRDINRPVLGIIFSSIVFMLAHALNPAVLSLPLVLVNLFTAGVLLSMAYLVADNIWFPTALHWGWNVTQGVVFNIPVSGLKTGGIIGVELDPTTSVVVTGGSFGLEGSIVVFVLQLVIIGYFISRYKTIQKSKLLDPPAPVF